MKAAQLRERAAAISFRQLRMFESVGRLSSVRQGAEECNLSQPAVTQALAKLEMQLSVTLLERHTSGSYLTDAGRIFHVRVRRMVEQMESALGGLGVSGGSASAAISNRISRSQVRCLTAIIEIGSFAKAADALGLTQASLQRAARDLEGNLRKTIFHRTAAGVMVTPDGIEFGRKLKLAAQEVEWGVREIETARGGKLSQIVIGTLPFGGSLLLATVLDEFVRMHPDADIKIVTEGASEMLKRLRGGEVDLVLGVVQETTAHDLRNEGLAKTPYQVVGRRGHPLLLNDGATLDDLAGFDWVVGSEGSSRRICFDNLFFGKKPPKASIATSALPIILHLLTNSDRLTLMTSYELVYEGNTLVEIPFGSMDPSPSIGITMRSEWLPTALHQDFIKLLREKVGASMVPLPLPLFA